MREQDPTVAVVRVRGDVALASGDAVAAQIVAAMASRPERLVIDLADCRFFDVVGVHVFLTVRCRATQQSCDLVLRGCSERHLRLLTLLKVSHHFGLAPGTA